MPRRKATTPKVEEAETKIVETETKIEEVKPKAVVIEKKVEAEPKKATWVSIRGTTICGNCKKEPVVNRLGHYALTKYCPNCGFEMLNGK